MAKSRKLEEGAPVAISSEVDAAAKEIKAKADLTPSGVKIVDRFAMLSTMARPFAYLGKRGEDLKLTKKNKSGEKVPVEGEAAKKLAMERKYSTFSSKLRGADTVENNRKAAEIIKTFISNNSDLDSQKKNAQATMEAVWAVYNKGTSSGGGRGPRVANTAMTMDDLDF